MSRAGGRCVSHVLQPRRTAFRLRPRVGAKFLLAIGALVAAVVAVAGVGVNGLSRMAQKADTQYTHSVIHNQHSADVLADTYAVQQKALYRVAVSDRDPNSPAAGELEMLLIPRLQAAVAALRNDYASDAERLQSVAQIDAGLAAYLQVLGDSKGLSDDAPMTDSARMALATRIDLILGPIIKAASSLRDGEAQDAAALKRASDDTHRSTQFLLIISSLLALGLGLAVVLALTRNLVPRIRRYSHFAADVAAGRPTTALQSRGGDELAELGTALDDMVRQREQADAAEHAARNSVTQAEQRQAEFVETLQVTRSEDEAQELLQRHLERSLPDSAVAVLRRNNSANRLQAATALPPSSQLATRLVGAEPRSCVAVRLGRTHREGPGRSPLLCCGLCGDEVSQATCEPLLVGGQVIGSVLVTRPTAYADNDDLQITSTVRQAAPVLANLRSLALAEFRANNDSLTGLPNKRATEDTLKRMVAQAGRSVTTLTAIMLDLDHFKEVNDRFGHALGDEVLAAVGTAISASIRGSDFAGRFGGEEFLILMPDTTVEGAWHVAEKIRRAIAAIMVPGVERDITASLGIAGLLEHAGNASGLLREADRAQYAAKAAGRNCTIVSVDAAAASPSAAAVPGATPTTPGAVPAAPGATPVPRDAQVASAVGSSE